MLNSSTIAGYQKLKHLLPQAEGVLAIREIRSNWCDELLVANRFTAFKHTLYAF